MSEVDKSKEAATLDVLAEIAGERRRQREVEGWTAKHDDAHHSGEMARAAVCYALPPGYNGTVLGDEDHRPLWPWDLRWWKPKGRRRDLVRAAALIVAEIERLDRAALAPEPGHDK